jgi:hypothetical protein
VTVPVKCRGGCGRWLRTKESIVGRNGYGPDCWERLNGLPARIRTSNSDDQMPGQTELALEPRQVTLWSL